MRVQEKLECIFHRIEDPRLERTKKHPLGSILFVVLCSVMAGIDDWVGMQDYCEANLEEFSAVVPLPYGAPSHDTIGRLMSRLDPEAFHECFAEFTLSLKERLREVIAIDGKTMRGSGELGMKAPLHMVSAWATQNRLVLAQVAVDEKSNEITAVPKLLNMLDLEKQVVTMDAMGCQREAAQSIIEKGGDYVLSLKGNQGSLHEDVKFLFEGFDDQLIRNFEGDYHEEYDKGHGRIEHRRCWVTDDLGPLIKIHNWPGLQTVAMVESERKVNGKVSSERRFFVSSLGPDAKLIGNAIRAHWEVENKLHWVLDVTYNEDRSQVYKDNSPENLSLIRKWAINLLNKFRGKLSMRRMQKKICMSSSTLMELLNKII